MLYGFMYTAFMLGTSLSQLGASIVFDTTGSYRSVLMAAAACLVIGSVIATFLPRFDAALARPLSSGMTAGG